MKTKHLIRGKLSGHYSTLLAADKGKRLFSILRIDEEQGWNVIFAISEGDRLHEYDGLSKAVRAYDDENY